MKTNYPHYVITEKPALVQVGKLYITVHEDNSIEIEGHNNLNFNCAGDLNINAKKINMTGEDDVVLESKTHLVHMAPRIDLNPHHEAPSLDDRLDHIHSLKGTPHDHGA